MQPPAAAADSLVARVRAFIKGAEERELAADVAYQGALDRIRRSTAEALQEQRVPERNEADWAIFVERQRAAENAATAEAAERFALSPWRIIEYRETPVVGDARVRASRTTPDDSHHEQDLAERIAAGDYLVKEGDSEKEIALEDRANGAELNLRRARRAEWKRRAALSKAAVTAKSEAAKDREEWLRTALEASSSRLGASLRASLAEEWLSNPANMPRDDFDALFPARKDDEGRTLPRVTRDAVRRATGKK